MCKLNFVTHSQEVENVMSYFDVVKIENQPAEAVCYLAPKDGNNVLKDVYFSWNGTSDKVEIYRRGESETYSMLRSAIRFSIDFKDPNKSIKINSYHLFDDEKTEICKQLQEFFPKEIKQMSVQRFEHAK